MAFWKRGNTQSGDDAESIRLNASADAEPVNSAPTRAGSVSRAVSRASIRVSADDPTADFQTIAEAIQAARPFDTISIGKGRYSEDVLVDKPLHFLGDPGEDEEHYLSQLFISPTHTINWSHSGGSFKDIQLTLVSADPDSYGTVSSLGYTLFNVDGGTLELVNCRLNGRAEVMVSVSNSGIFKAIRSTFDRDGIWSIKGQGSGSIELVASNINARRVDDYESDNDNGIEIEGAFNLRMQDCKTDSTLTVRDGTCAIQNCRLTDVQIYGGNGQIERATLRDLSVVSGGSAVLDNCQLCNHRGSSLTVMMGGRATLRNSTIVPSFNVYKDATLELDDCIVVESPQHQFHWVRENSILNAVDTVFATGAGETIVIGPGCNVHVDGQRFLPNHDFR